MKFGLLQVIMQDLWNTQFAGQLGMLTSFLDARVACPTFSQAPVQCVALRAAPP